MEALKAAIYTTPIIDHHAHNLLLPSKLEQQNQLSIFSEATGAALNDSTSTLAHIRGVRQLADICGCEPTWDAVKVALAGKHKEPEDAWAKQCFSGIETVLIDDGLDPIDVHPCEWHDRLVRSPCKIILRIERLAEEIIQAERVKTSASQAERFASSVQDRFQAVIDEAIRDPRVAGFKSVICYRTGLVIPSFEHVSLNRLGSFLREISAKKEVRLKHEYLNPYFVHLTAQALRRHTSKKPFQFHTGLGDNDIILDLSNPAHLQPFIETYTDVIIVLLHASYPFTKEAGYLAAVYGNTYLDIGEIFPFLSREGQVNSIHESLDLCPSEKLLWSTDGHWFPETYLLAVIQIREGLEEVLCQYVARGSLTVDKAVKIVQDLFFSTANRLYNLDLEMRPPTSSESFQRSNKNPDVAQLERFLQQNPAVKFLRLQWLDYTATARGRLLPVKRALKMFRENNPLPVTKAVFGILQPDILVGGVSSVGEYDLIPIFDSVRLSGRPKHATIQSEIREDDGIEIDTCPRTILRRQVEKGSAFGISFLVGFEIEVVFLQREFNGDHMVYGLHPVSNEGGHHWSAVRALHDNKTMDLIEAIVADLDTAGIEVQQFHAESAPGQYEFVLPPFSPLEAVDTLLAARDIITQAVSDADLRATLYPKPFPARCGTGAHTHISLQPPDRWQSFYAAVLDNLPALSALTYANEVSYERVLDGVWAGGTWIAWGPQNRETPLRQIADSHFEIRCVDGLSNPYLMLAGILGCGLQGMADDKPLVMKPCMDSPAQLSDKHRRALGINKRFPKSIEEALNNLKEAETLRSVLGQAVVDNYYKVKTAEHEMLKQMDEERRKNWLIERY